MVYKAFDNLGGLRTLFGVDIDQKSAILVFGLFHGLGLATKLQALRPSRDGLIENMIAFNVGVELGQLLALSIILAVMLWWRRRPGFAARSAGGQCIDHERRLLVDWISGHGISHSFGG